MHNTAFHHWLSRESFGEHRFCFQVQQPKPAPDVQPQTPSQAPDRPQQLDSQRQGFWDWLKEKTGEALETTGALAMETGKFLIVDVPTWMLDRLKGIWEKTMPSKEEAAAFLHRAALFFRDVPLIGTLIEKYHLEPADMQSMENLTDYTLWIEAFRDAEILQRPQVAAAPIAPGEVLTPATFLEKLTPVQRQEIFLQVIDRFIPSKVQQEMLRAGKAGVGADSLVPVKDDEWKNLPLAERIKHILSRGRDPLAGEAEQQKETEGENVGRFTNVLDLMFGLKEPKENGQEADWAKRSIDWNYNPLDLFRKQNGQNTEEITRGLWQDYQAALQMQRLSGAEDVATKPQLLESQLGPSLFKGALRLGAVDENTLQSLYDEKQEWDATRVLAKADNARAMDTMYQSSKSELAKEAMGIKDVWYGLSGTEKLVLFAVGAFLMTQKWFRNLAAIGVGAYFVQKFAFKTEDPLEQWSDWIYSGKKKILQTIPEQIQRTMPGYAPNLNQRASIMTEFLSDMDRQYLETQALGFGLIADVPLGTLATNFGQAEGKWTLDVDRGGTVDTTMSAAAENHGFAKRYREFFDGGEGPQNRAQVGEALAYMFYRKAAADPQHRYLASVEKVERAMRLLPRHCTYASLRGFGSSVEVQAHVGQLSSDVQENTQLVGPAMLEAADEFDRLVLLGREACLGSTQSLGRYVEDVVGLQNTQNRLVKNKVAGAPEAPPASPAVAEGDVASRTADLSVESRIAEAEAAKATLEVAVQQRDAEVRAGKPVAEVDAAKHRVGIAMQRCVEAEAARCNAEADSSLRTAEEDVVRRQAEAQATQSAETDAALKTAEAVVADRQADVNEMRRAMEAIAGTRLLAEDVMLKLSATDAARQQLTEATAAHNAAIAAGKPDAEMVALNVQVEAARQRVSESEVVLRRTEAEWRLRQSQATVTRLQGEVEVGKRTVESVQKSTDEALRSGKPEAEVRTARAALEAARTRQAELESAVQAAEADVRSFQAEYDSQAPASVR